MAKKKAKRKKRRAKKKNVQLMVVTNPRKKKRKKRKKRKTNPRVKYPAGTYKVKKANPKKKRKVAKRRNTATKRRWVKVVKPRRLAGLLLLDNRDGTYTTWTRPPSGEVGVISPKVVLTTTLSKGDRAKIKTIRARIKRGK